MQRVLVLGCCGSGKSTFATQLHQITQLPLIHLDEKYFKPNWTEPSEKEWRSIVEKLAGGEQWIMDGNYGGTWDLRIPRADTIIYLDKPTSVCMYRVLKRIFKYHGQVRPDMAEGCKERFDFEFLHYVMMFNMLRRKKYFRLFDEIKNEKQILIFKKQKEIEDFLEEIKK